MIFIYVCKSIFSNQKFSAEKKSSMYIVVSYIKSELEKAGGVCCLKSFPNVQKLKVSWLDDDDLITYLCLTFRDIFDNQTSYSNDFLREKIHKSG